MGCDILRSFHCESQATIYLVSLEYSGTKARATRKKRKQLYRRWSSSSEKDIVVAVVLLPSAAPNSLLQVIHKWFKFLKAFLVILHVPVRISRSVSIKCETDVDIRLGFYSNECRNPFKKSGKWMSTSISLNFSKYFKETDVDIRFALF
ncbi:hypothetical protein DEO72_LG9g1358 [Vigna unguiculata]|uniref:Uncharacterized protein n=1 Tax=Vigna unguiculata TaxID=3917 RepID=A0A4D6MY15_VIGUN|nr:hypothetical protein DEO72_LG9g1358 [Vigna unguiculata]